MVELSIIIPTYNERENLPLLLWSIADTFKENLPSVTFEVVVVDDSSPDGTGDVCRELQKMYKNVKLVSRPGKLGLGSAYISGLKEAGGEAIILMDADLSHDPKYIPAFLSLFRPSPSSPPNYDIISGSRYIKGGGVCGWDTRRVLMSRVANYMAQVLLNPGASDLTGSFRLYRRRALEDIINEMTGKGYVFQMEILVRAKNKGFTVGEVPIKFVDRIYGESKLGVGEVLGYLKGLWTLFWTL